LWAEYPFLFKITEKRESKYGDYFFSPPSTHIITLNNDLNKYAFLITYLHEVAHMLTGLEYGHRVKPHGEEWKSVFIKVLWPMMREEVFPQDVLTALSKYLKN